jgi:hypothetical protein
MGLGSTRELNERLAEHRLEIRQAFDRILNHSEKTN